MLVLFETAAGFAIFKLLDEKKLASTENLFDDFQNPEKASKIVTLKHFCKFKDTTEALAAVTASIEGKMSKGLRKMLKKVIAVDAHEQLAVADAKLGNAIKDKLNIPCVYNSSINELMRCMRSQMDSLIAGLPQKEIAAMALGLAHSLSRYKLKFSPDKVDTMIVQAVSLLDDLDKELNNYIMRCREWYGWHFPELSKILTDNNMFVRTIKFMGMRTNALGLDFSEVLPEDLEESVKAAAEISMGTEISEEDIGNIQFLCDQVIEMSQYRSQLYDYLKNRMMAIAPNLMVLVGELVGARLISHAGSLLNLAKHPASTVQILGAEKALFRAIKTKHDTPKYGLIYHAQLVGQSSTKLKGKISRMLAAKAALACRVDALGEDVTSDLGIQSRAKLEIRLKALEGGKLGRISGTGKQMMRFERYQSKSEVREYKPQGDIQMDGSKKRMIVEESEQPKKKKKTKQSIDKGQAIEHKIVEESMVQPKKKKKIKQPVGKEIAHKILEEVPTEQPKKKKTKQSVDEGQEIAHKILEVPTEQPKKKRKMKQSVDEGQGKKVIEHKIVKEEITEHPKKKKKVKPTVDEGQEIEQPTEQLKKKKKTKQTFDEGQGPSQVSAVGTHIKKKKLKALTSVSPGEGPSIQKTEKVKLKKKKGKGSAIS